MTLSVLLPFRRRQSRWDRIKGSVTSRREMRRRMRAARRLRRSLPDATRLRDLLPDTATVARVAQPLVGRVGSATSNITVPEPPAFLQERLHLDRLSTLGRQKPSAGGRVLDSEAPLWLAIGLAIGGLVVGYALGRAAAGRGVPGIKPEQLEAAAGKIKDQWPSVHDDDIREAKGNIKRLSSVIGERTGESTRAIRDQLATMTSGQSNNGGGGE